jgi:phosphopantetheinyl transferase
LPIHTQKEINSHGRLAVWKTAEPLEELIDLMGAANVREKLPARITNHERKLQWAATRVLFRTLAGAEQNKHIGYDSYGKPFITGSKSHLSISHTGDYVALIFSRKHAVGIDIEQVLPRIENLSIRFMNENEKKWIDYQNRIRQLYVIWGAKETIFKMDGKGGIDFRKHIEVLPFKPGSSGEVDVLFKKYDEVCRYTIFYEYLNDLVLTWGISS